MQRLHWIYPFMPSLQLAELSGYGYGEKGKNWTFRIFRREHLFISCYEPYSHMRHPITRKFVFIVAHPMHVMQIYSMILLVLAITLSGRFYPRGKLHALLTVFVMYQQTHGFTLVINLSSWTQNQRPSKFTCLKNSFRSVVKIDHGLMLKMVIYYFNIVHLTLIQTVTAEAPPPKKTKKTLKTLLHN